MRVVKQPVEAAGGDVNDVSGDWNSSGLNSSLLQEHLVQSVRAVKQSADMEQDIEASGPKVVQGVVTVTVDGLKYPGVKVGAWFYATLDRTDPLQTRSDCQEDDLTLRYDDTIKWEIPEDYDEVIDNVIAPYPWGTWALVVYGNSGGSYSHWTALATELRSNGTIRSGGPVSPDSVYPGGWRQHASGGALRSLGNRRYLPHWCDERVLMRTSYELAITTTTTTVLFKKGSTKCWNAGNDRASRDASCEGNLVCSRNNFDGRCGGCDGAHCCSNPPKNKYSTACANDFYGCNLTTNWKICDGASDEFPRRRNGKDRRRRRRRRDYTARTMCKYASQECSPKAPTCYATAKKEDCKTCEQCQRQLETRDWQQEADDCCDDVDWTDALDAIQNQ